jgi:hypothetical protein
MPDLPFIQFVRQIPQVLTGVIKIDNLDGTGKMLFGNVPNPFRSSTNRKSLPTLTSVSLTRYNVASDRGPVLSRTMEGWN